MTIYITPPHQHIARSLCSIPNISPHPPFPFLDLNTGQAEQCELQGRRRASPPQDHRVRDHEDGRRRLRPLLRRPVSDIIVLYHTISYRTIPVTPCSVLSYHTIPYHTIHYPTITLPLPYHCPTITLAYRTCNLLYFVSQPSLPYSIPFYHLSDVVVNSFSSSFSQ